MRMVCWARTLGLRICCSHFLSARVAVRLGITRGSLSGAAAAAVAPLRTERVALDLQNLDKLANGRIDLVLIDKYLAAGLMALTDMLVSFPDSLPLLLAFLLEVALGALSYSLALLGLWALSGRPQGAEAYILAKLKLSRFLPAAQRSDVQ